MKGNEITMTRQNENQKLKIEYVPINTLKAYENNAKIHTPEQIEQIKRSIEEFGFNDPIAVWHDNEIIEGHGRLMAGLEMGIETVPIIRLDDLTDDQRKAYMLVHNKLTMNTDFDFSILETELQSITEISMDDYGFDMSFDDIEEEKEIEEADIPDDVETRVKLGDLWQLGDHRLICGDSCDLDVIETLMGGEKMDMVFTDPPYGVNIVNDSGKVGADNLAKNGIYAPVIGDNTTETARKAYEIYRELCNRIILWGGNYFLEFLPSSDGWIIWDKRGERDIRNNFADGEMAWCSFHTPVRIYHQLWMGMIREGEHEKRVHPTQKPTKTIGDILKDFSKENENILDSFGGSGSTLIACEQLNRRCFMAELDPHYCDVIIQRWENFTGKKAEKIGGSK